MARRVHEVADVVSTEIDARDSRDVDEGWDQALESLLEYVWLQAYEHLLTAALQGLARRT